MLKKSSFIHIFIIACISLHAFVMNGHYHHDSGLCVGTYVDPIAAEADPSLFTESLYVQAAQRTTVDLWFLFDLYVYLYERIDFELFVIALSITSLFFTLSGLYAISRSLFSNAAVGFISLLLFTAEAQSWLLGCPGPYLNFFHHGLPFVYPLITWSIAFFLRKKLVLSLLLCGIAFNFHIMYIFFLLLCYAAYVLFYYHEFKWSRIALGLICFLVPALPTIISTVSFMGSITSPGLAWFDIARLTAGYQCFPSSWPYTWILQAALFFALFCISLFAMQNKKKTVLFITGCVVLMCFIGTVFTDMYPIPVIIRLSFWRSSIIYFFLALPCIANFLFAGLRGSTMQRFTAISIMVIITGYVEPFDFYYLPLFTAWYLVEKMVPGYGRSHEFFRQAASPVFVILLCGVFVYRFIWFEPSWIVPAVLAGIFIFSVYLSAVDQRQITWYFPLQKPFALSVLFIILFDTAVLCYQGGPVIYYHGRPVGKEIDSWADIQMAARRISDKDDLFIIPPGMSSFGIYSHRATLGDWAEAGNAVYSDNRYAEKSLERMHDLGWKRFDTKRKGINSLSTDEVKRVAGKHGAEYVVTKKPKTFNLKKVYENNDFILYEIPEQDK